MPDSSDPHLNQTAAEVVFYETSSGRMPVAEFLTELNKGAPKNKETRRSEKAHGAINMLANRGARTETEIIKHLRGRIWELRPLCDRILFAKDDGNCYVLLSGFHKTSNRTPAREIDTAERRLADWNSRLGHK